MEKFLLTFTTPATARDWKTVDDVVMGGRSHSRIHWLDEPVAGGEDRRGLLRFEGRISLENNGGFCSTRLASTDRGVSGVEQLHLLVRGDGRRYKCTVRTADTPRKTSWRLPFETQPGRWSEVVLPLSRFELWRRGTHLSDTAELDPAAMTSLGLLVSDGQEGDFRIDLGRIWAH